MYLDPQPSAKTRNIYMGSMKYPHKKITLLFCGYIGFG